MKVYRIYIKWDKTGHPVCAYAQGVFISLENARRAVAAWTKQGGCYAIVPEPVLG